VPTAQPEDAGRLAAGSQAAAETARGAGGTTEPEDVLPAGELTREGVPGLRSQLSAYEGLANGFVAAGLRSQLSAYEGLANSLVAAGLGSQLSAYGGLGNGSVAAGLRSQLSAYGGLGNGLVAAGLRSQLSAYADAAQLAAGARRGAQHAGGDVDRLTHAPLDHFLEGASEFVALDDARGGLSAAALRGQGEEVVGRIRDTGLIPQAAVDVICSKLEADARGAAMWSREHRRLVQTVVFILASTGTLYLLVGDFPHEWLRVLQELLGGPQASVLTAGLAGGTAAKGAGKAVDRY
jgi:hypothetical protein